MIKVLRKMDKKINIFKYTIESQHADLNIPVH